MFGGSIRFQSRHNHCQISAGSARPRSAKKDAEERFGVFGPCCIRRYGAGKIEGGGQGD